MTTPKIGRLMPGDPQRCVDLRYRNPHTGREVRWTVPVPCAPHLLRAMEYALEKRGYVRVDDATS